VLLWLDAYNGQARAAASGLYSLKNNSCLRLSGAGYRHKTHKKLRVTGVVRWGWLVSGVAGLGQRFLSVAASASASATLQTAPAARWLGLKSKRFN